MASVRATAARVPLLSSEERATLAQGETPMAARITVGLLVLLNVIVLLGQIWPEGAPPFARGVNLTFLAANLVFLVVRHVRGTHESA